MGLGAWFDGFGAAFEDGDFDLLGERAGGDLVAEHVEDFGAGADERDAGSRQARAKAAFSERKP